MHRIPPSVVHHSLSLFLPPSEDSLGRMILHSSESKHSPLWAFKLCLFSKLYVCECCSGDPHTPSPTNTTTNDIPLLASVQYTAWENTTAPWKKKEMEGRSTNQEFGQSPISLSHASPLCHIAYINPSLSSQTIRSCELDVGKVGVSGASGLFDSARWKMFFLPARRGCVLCAYSGY